MRKILSNRSIQFAIGTLLLSIFIPIILERLGVNTIALWSVVGIGTTVGIAFLVVGLKSSQRQEVVTETSKKHGQKSNESRLRDKLVQFKRYLANSASNLKRDEIDMGKLKQALNHIEEHDKGLMQLRGYPTEYPEAVIYAALNTYGVGTDWLIQHDPKSSNLWGSIESLKSSVESGFKSLAISYIQNLNIAVSQILFHRYIDFIPQITQRSFTSFASKVTLYGLLDKVESDMNTYIKEVEKKGKRG